MPGNKQNKARHVFGLQTAARAAHFNAVRQTEAFNILNAERLKKTRRKVLEQILTRAALQRGAQHVRAGGVVHKARAGLIFKLVRKEILNPLRLVHVERIDLRLVAAGHRKQIAHRAGKQIFARIFRHLVREQLAQAVVKRQRSLLARKADGRGGQRLCKGEHHVWRRRIIRLPPTFCAHLAVAQQHHAVQLKPSAFCKIDKFQYAFGMNTHAFRRDSFQYHKYNHLPFDTLIIAQPPARFQ